MMKSVLFFFAAVLIAGLAGCYSTKPLENSQNVPADGVVFVRPDQYVIAFGSRSLSEYLALNGKNLLRNSSGMLEVTALIQYRGPHNWYNFLRRAPRNVTVNVRADFYAGAVGQGAPIYSTNRQTIVLRLGDTSCFKAVCPLRQAQSCQLVLSE